MFGEIPARSAGSRPAGHGDRHGRDPQDIAAMAVFLASPRGGNVTGQTVNVDGGYVMHA